MNEFWSVFPLFFIPRSILICDFVVHVIVPMILGIPIYPKERQR